MTIRAEGRSQPATVWRPSNTTISGSSVSAIQASDMTPSMMKLAR